MTDTDKMTGNQLDAIRRELGMSYNELAAALNMTGANADDTLRKMARGKSNVTERIAKEIRALI